MITENTVFVLGAGCSAPYRFPLGRDLRNLIIERLEKESHQELRILRELHARQDIEEFREALRYSGKVSIDAFLEHRADLREIGKRAIAATLIPFEHPKHVFPKEDHWYERLYQKMNAPVESFDDNQVTFITFNYDRSLEYYLYTALKHTYNQPDEKVAEQLRAITVIHPHGQLGLLPWQTQQGNSRPYVNEVTAEFVKTAANGIRVIHEASDEDALRSVDSTLTWAHRIFFIGFAYDETNVKRLKVQNRKASKVGSCYLMTNLEQNVVRRLIDGIQLAGPHLDAIGFLREHVP